MARKKIMTEKSSSLGNFKIKIGTLDKLHPETIHIECGTFIMPINNLNDEEYEGYEEIIDLMERELKNAFKDNIKESGMFDKQYLFLLDVPIERIHKDKKSYLSIQTHVKPLKIQKLNQTIDEMQDLLDKLFQAFETIINGYGFRTSKTKQE